MLAVHLLSVLDPIREVTEDIYEVQTTTIVDGRELVEEYVDLVSQHPRVQRR